MKRWIIRISITLLTIFFLFTGGLLFLLGTQSGTNIIVTQAEKLMNGQLVIGSATGTILSRLECNNLVFQSPAAGKTEVGNFILDWKSSDLFSLHLHVIEASATNISYTASQLKTTEATSTDPLILPDLSLPVTITLKKVAANAVKFYSTADAEPVIISSTTLSALWNNEGILLKEFSLSMPEAEVHINGKILPTGYYPLSLTSEIKTLSSEYPAVTLVGEYGGDLQKLSIKTALRGDIEADIHGTLQDVLNALAWDIKINIINFTPETLSPDVPGTINGSLTSTGTLQNLNATAQISMRDKKELYVNWDADLDVAITPEPLHISVKQCTLSHFNSSAVIDLAGTVDAKQQLDIALNWKELQWPVTGNAEYSSPAGMAKLTGTVDDYHLTMDSSVTGTEIPEATIQLSSNGNTDQAKDIQLNIETLAGTITVTGDVEWTPMVKWQVETRADTINPGVQYSEWPGALNWLIKSDGYFDDAGVLANVTINNLQGILRELPIAGSGDIEVAPDTIQINKLLLSSGNAKLVAEGLLGPASDLKWNIQIADFSDLLPQSSGQLSATGTVVGKMAAPQVTAKLSGTSIITPQAEIEDVQLEADLDLSWTKPFIVDLSVESLKIGENLIPEITLHSNGKITQHSLNLFASHELATLSLAMQGGYDEEQWQGTLSSLVLDSKDMGTWETHKRTEIMAAAKSAKLEQLCLTRGESDLCLSGAWDAENNNTGGTASLIAFPLNWLSAWFPETLEDLGGFFSFDATARMEEKLQATAQARITPGEIKYVSIKDTGTLSHEGLTLDIQVADDGIDGDLWLSVESNIISGELQSPDLLRKNAEHSPSLNGKIKIDAKNFTLAETLIEDIKNLNAQVDTDFTIKGTLAAPEVNGTGKLQINNILIPAAGLELTNTSLDILADNSELKINGVFNSGKGSMALNGTALLDADKNYPAFITLKGKNFRLVNLPEIQVYLSSDLTMEKKTDLTLLSGTVEIPKADILLRNLPQGTVTASPDIVIVQEQKEETDTKSPIQMDLTVRLGKKVYFAGFGVNAFIDGQLNITAEPEEQMLGSGEFHIRQGSYRAYGQDLEIENGVISFPGGPLTQPGVNLRATRSVGDVVAGISVIGPAKKPRITTFSRPPMSESQTLSYIITGASPSTGRAKLSVGRQINNKLSVSVGTDTKTGDSQFVARYRLSRKINVETTTGTSSNAADIFYTTEFGGDDSTKKEPQEKTSE